MSTVILADSRLKGIEKQHQFPSSRFTFNVKSGSQIKDHKIFVKHLSKGHRQYQLYIIAVGINDIPEDIADKTPSEIEKLVTKIKAKFRSLCKSIKEISPEASIVIATIPPKCLLQSVRKYPRKSTINEHDITKHHQKSFEHFVSRINSFIDEFNVQRTGKHLSLHTNLRTHRGRRRCKYTYHKLTDGLHPGQELKREWWDRILDLHQSLTH
ncbi:MAG: SGNH/GDSL hydrolase family protein [Sedimenticola sp.]